VARFCRIPAAPQVEGVAHGPAEPVQGVYDDHVPAAGVAQQGFQPGPVGSSPGFLVDIDMAGGDAGSRERVDLPVEVLFGGGHPRVAQLHAGRPYRNLCR